MSTRANIIVKDKYSHLFFYRHSDGYPEGVQTTLLKFMDGVKNGPLRDNLSQASGWLIILGAMEYGAIPTEFAKDKDGDPAIGTIEFKDWKVGAYEPTSGLHGDIQHLYVVDLEAKEVRELAIEWDKDHNPKENWETFKVLQVLTEKAISQG